MTILMTVRHIFFLTGLVLLLSGCEGNQDDKSDVKQSIDSTAMPNKQSKPSKQTADGLEIVTAKRKNDKPASEASQNQASMLNEGSDDEIQVFSPFDASESEDGPDQELINLIEILQTEVEPEGRLEAVRKLEDFSDSETFGALLSALDDTDIQVRHLVVKMLAEIDLFAAVEGMVYALNDSDPDVVISAITALEDRGDVSMIPKLEHLQTHPDRKVQQKAQQAIENLQE